MRTIEDIASDEQKGIINQLPLVLNEVSYSSRSGLDICGFWKIQGKQNRFDVFMCHNSEDKNEIRTINDRLKGSGINTWLDEEQLPPGRSWQELLEQQIDEIQTAAVFVGGSGMGPWQSMEIRAFLNEFAPRRCPVIPVILPSCSNVPTLPIFLRQFTWVDFRKDEPEPYNHLLWGITGNKP
jgi:hypothetical protein